MQASFAFTNDSDNEFDALGALNVGTLEQFGFEVADVSPLTYIKGKPFKWELLDASQYELKTRCRLKGQFTTKPDLVLNANVVDSLDMWGVTFQQYVLTFKELMVRWAFARSRWLYIREAGVYTPSPDIFSVNLNAPSAMPDSGSINQLAILPYLKVILDSDFNPSKFEGLLLGQQVTVDWSSALAFDI